MPPPNSRLSRARAKQQAEIAQGDVVKARDQQKVHDDAPQPEHDDVRTDPGIEGDRHPGSNLDDTDHEQEGVSAEGQDLRDSGARYWSQLTS
jgi:hypothetical protein